MPRKNKDGKFILSAGEIGSYTVCPEAWRLSTLENVKTEHTENDRKGRELHKSWAEVIDEASYLKRRAQLLVLLLLLTAILVVLF